MTDSTAYRALAAAALAALLPACGLHGPPAVERRGGSDRAPPESRAVPQEAAAPAAVQVVAPGMVEPWGGEVELSAQEAGPIARLLVREGERVEAGRVLAVLEDGAQREAVALAEAERDEAEAALQRAVRGSTPEELRQAEAEESAALARARLARSADERAQRLRRGGAGAEGEAEGAAAEAQALAALAERARARLEEVRRGPRLEDLRAARARAASARARLRLAQAALQRRQVVAPSGGVVLRSRFHAGEWHAPGGEPLLSLGDLGRLQVRLEVDEIDAGEVRPDTACAIRSDDGLRLAEGIVSRLAPRMGRRALQTELPTARSDVRVREVFVEIPAAAGLVPGQRVWGHLPRAGAAQAAAGKPTPRGG
ncbi:MAG: biotin/lipoyl-binding protein [Deltaproteobacteria bacterium]|nr:biotin/lipoyl-binding protein [Deltaproteobacteria bacterium]